MKKVLSIAFATVFALAVSAQTTPAVKNENGNSKVEKVAPKKMNTPTQKAEAQTANATEKGKASEMHAKKEAEHMKSTAENGKKKNTAKANHVAKKNMAKKSDPKSQPQTK